MSKWEEKRVKPVLPLYLAALVFLVASLLLPPYRLSHLLIVAGLSLAAYAAGRRRCPTRVVRTLVPYATGSEDVDAMLEGIARNLDALHALNDDIPDPALSAAMDRMEKAGRSIVQAVESTPEKAGQVNRFARYYLPEVIKILGAYVRMEKGGVKGDNAAQILREVRGNAETMATAFENQLDALFSAEAMDVSTDIEVLDGILKSQNLTK
ncbi:MAG: 5-bromo-4-chloroindolyl phosphate hydrolysis family protein [Gemmiger sp.]